MSIKFTLIKDNTLSCWCLKAHIDFTGISRIKNLGKEVVMEEKVKMIKTILSHHNQFKMSPPQTVSSSCSKLTKMEVFLDYKKLLLNPILDYDCVT